MSSSVRVLCMWLMSAVFTLFLLLHVFVWSQPHRVLCGMNLGFLVLWAGSGVSRSPVSPGPLDPSASIIGRRGALVGHPLDPFRRPVC